MGIVPKISIVTPSYNQGEFLEETINSILNQNYQNLEYIIIDGGSTDNSVEIIRKYEEHLSYWISEKDEGQSHAINKGFAIATGEICNWINSDDILAPNALQNISKAFINNPNVDFVHGKNGIIDSESKLTGWTQHPKGELKLQYFYGMPYGQQACFFTKKIFDKVGGVNEKISFSMDFDLYTKIHLRAKALQIEDHIGSIRIHPTTKTNNLQNEMYYDNGCIMATLFRSLRNENYYNQLARLGFKSYEKYDVEIELEKNTQTEIWLGYLHKSFWYYYENGEKKIAKHFLYSLIRYGRMKLFNKETLKLIKDLAF